ncbi:hypothetical protein CFP56_002797 [Quercus suber]|uniref:RNase H type-1 domain-containing protein n=1 Tax=Quercus suber TaxID=58331 RepID=A0AAW0LDT6_QUESU
MPCKIHSPHSVELAEALACNRAVVFAQELCLTQVVFEGDSLRIVQAVNSQENKEPDGLKGECGG